MASVTFPVSLGGDGSTVTDDANPSTGLANGGHRTRFVPALAQLVAVADGGVTQATAQVALATTQADNASASANAAAASAASALTAPGVSATSASIFSIAVGSKVLTLDQTGKSFVVGQWVSISQTSNPTLRWLLGPITAFDSGTGVMTVNVTVTNGTGTVGGWTVAAATPTDAGYDATSTSSLAIGKGSKTVVLAQSNKAFAADQWVAITSAANPETQWMVGPITTWTPNTNTMVVNVVRSMGSGTLSSWVVAFATPYTDTEMLVTDVAGTTQTAVAGAHYVLSNVATTTVTLPAAPNVGDTVRVTVGNGLVTNVVARNGSNIMGLAEDMTLDSASVTAELRYVNATRGWVLL